MTRAEHLQWAKDRALAYLEPKKQQPQERHIAYSGGYSPWGRVHYPEKKVTAEDLSNAIASFVSDLGKHPETAGHAAIQMASFEMFGSGLSTEVRVREFIEGAN